MKKRIISALLCAIMTIGLVPCVSHAASIQAVNYLQSGDYVTILPAENQNGTVDYTTYAINAQSGGHINGQDVQLWDMGTAVKFCVMRCGEDVANTFALSPTNFRESEDASSTDVKYWDLEGKDTDEGTNIHVWEDDDQNDENKLFYLEEDGDGDPETFYLCSYYARNDARYLVPENYFKGTSWESDGRNIVLSKQPFTWRVQVLNRDAGDVDSAWMDDISDDTLLSSINIPGTHDSGTANVEGSWNEDANSVACQKYFIDELLYAGFRSFDIRYAYNSNEIVLVHGSGTFVCHNKDHDTDVSKEDTNLTLRQVLQTTVDYLKEHPSETVIMTLKQDDSNDSAPSEMAKVVMEFIEQGYCYDWSSDSPTLGEVRGKIVLMTRTASGSLKAGSSRKYFGPDISMWDDSYNDDIHFAQEIYSSSSDTGGIWIQDDYHCSDSNKQMQVRNVVEQLNKSIGSTTTHGDTITEQPDETDFVFNYFSKDGSDSTRYPMHAAWEMNDYLLTNSTLHTYFTTASSSGQAYRTGITVLDYGDKTLAQYIINSNFIASRNTVYYVDVSQSDWYYNAVQTAVQSGFFTGVSATQFSPDGEMTRAMMAQIIYNVAGKPLDSELENTFSDVADGKWYTNAVLWATSKGLMSGYGNGLFGPTDALTREQVVQVLYNCAVLEGFSTDGEADFSRFTDAANISDWAVDAMNWAVANEIVVGTDNSELLPQTLITRAQAAQIIISFRDHYWA